MNKDITVVLNGYKRAQHFDNQLKAVLNQTIKPKAVMLWQNGNDVEFPESSNMTTKAVCNDNLGVWARFAFALNARTEWICIPEVQNVGIHYNCFVKFNVSPCIGNGYESEKHWVEVALKNNLETLSSHFPSLGRGKPTVFVRERTRDRTEALKQFFYSAKEFQRGVSHNDIDPSFDRFERTLISREHWKNIPIHRHRTPNKVEHIPPLFDKETEQDLSKFTV